MKNKIKLAVLSLVSFSVVGCVTPPNINDSQNLKDKARYMSAGAIGCLPSDIEINFVDPKWNVAAVWTAKCKTIVHVCSYYGGENATVSCNPLAK